MTKTPIDNRKVPDELDDAAIPRICLALGLPSSAFSGEDGNDPRLTVMRSLSTLDVEACPGSGKTTLLVAKLAILSAQWIDARRGLCVLSHTNVARREIERRLGRTAEGQRLLSYPHFVGTIHGFVNEFLAIPWLRSNGYRIEVIDDAMAQEHRWRKLSYAHRTALEKAGKDCSVLKFRDTRFHVGRVAWGAGALGEGTSIYRSLVRVCRESADEGYFCHDEMLTWAGDLLDSIPEVAGVLRARFPLLFLDEVQDNSEDQSSLLHRVFVAGEGAVVRQRYGDSNQAIFQSTSATAARTDLFPASEIRTEIPNSFRFCQEIADLANPLAPNPIGLQGKRKVLSEQESETKGKHAIFLFDDSSIERVLDVYAAYLIETFSVPELQAGTFTAVGAVHQSDQDDNLPRHVRHYWPEYNPDIARANPKPRTFLQYVNSGRGMSRISGEARESVEMLAEAIIRLARLVDSQLGTGKGGRKHVFILKSLQERQSDITPYQDLVRALALERTPISKSTWQSEWRNRVSGIARQLTCSPVEGPGVDAFLTWDNASVTTPADRPDWCSKNNIFRFPLDKPVVSIRVGSIHAAKGETHTATLVLETFYRAHHLKALKSWLMGERVGGSRCSATLLNRMKLHYVAMTRPSRLLCLALREDALGDGEVAKLQRSGWRVARVTPERTEWYANGA